MLGRILSVPERKRDEGLGQVERFSAPGNVDSDNSIWLQFVLFLGLLYQDGLLEQVPKVHDVIVRRRGIMFPPVDVDDDTQSRSRLRHGIQSCHQDVYLTGRRPESFTLFREKKPLVVELYKKEIGTGFGIMKQL